MKILLSILFVLISVSLSYANPFLVGTKGPGGDPTTYEFTGLPLTPTVVPAQADGNFRIDLMSLPPGTYTVTVRAINLWGVSEYSDPFSFTRPAGIGKPGTLGLIAQ